jgi:transcriptional regulator with XRE-family HTH domain
MAAGPFNNLSDDFWRRRYALGPVAANQRDISPKPRSRFGVGNIALGEKLIECHSRNLHEMHMHVKHALHQMVWNYRGWGGTYARVQEFLPLMPPVKKQARQRGRHFIKEWREYRQLTQETLAERLNVSPTTVGRIENYKVPYNQDFLELTAYALRCEPWDLLNVNPNMAGEVVDLVRIIRDADENDRAAIIGFARGRISRNDH